MPGIVQSICNAQQCICTGGIGQYRHGVAIFHWKILCAGSEFANSLTIERNFRVPTTKRATNKMADATTSGRNLSIKYPTIADLRNAIPLIRIRSYTTTDRQLFLWRDVHSRSPTTTTEESLRSSAFYRNPPRGSRGHQVQTGWICTWLSIGFYLLHAIRSLAFTFKMADNIDSQTTIDK